MNQLFNQYPDEIRQILGKYPEAYQRSAVMPLLFLAQRKTGHLTEQDIQDIAQIIGISSTDVSSVAGFYTLFHIEEPGKTAPRYRIQVCNDLPCALRGADRFLEELCAALGLQVGEPSADGLFVIEEVKCLAACHRAPMFQLQGDGSITYHEHQTVESARALIETLCAHAASSAETSQAIQPTGGAQ